MEQYLHGVCNFTSIWVYFFGIYNALIYIDKICSAQITDPKQKQNKLQQTELTLTDSRQVMKRKSKINKQYATIALKCLLRKTKKKYRILVLSSF